MALSFALLFKRLTKNYIQNIPACKEQSFDPLSQ